MANKHEKQRDFHKKMTEWRKEQQAETKKQDKESEKEFKLPNEISTSYTIIKTIDDDEGNER